MADDKKPRPRPINEGHILQKGYVPNPKSVAGGHQPQTTSGPAQPPSGGSAVKPPKK